MITKNYIKQCEKAEEIQKGWKPKIGDYIYLKENENMSSVRENQIYLITDIVGVKISYINTFTGIDSWCYENRLKSYFTYIPTQEQLWEEIEELLFGEKCELNIIVHDGNEYIIEAWQILGGQSCVDVGSDTYTNTYKAKGENIKECLLKLIMKINWNKSWTGEKWVKAE